MSEKKIESESGSISGSIARESQHYWFVDGLANSLLPRLDEIQNTEELVASECTMDLIEYSFARHKINLVSLDPEYLSTIAFVMPLIIGHLKRLDYPLLKPVLFERVCQFADSVNKEVKYQRDKINKILGD